MSTVNSSKTTLQNAPDSESQTTKPSFDVEKPVDSETPSSRQIHGIKWFFAACAILSSTFLFALDNTVVANCQPSIVNEFNGVDKLPWLGAAFSLGGTSILAWGRIYSLFNIKWLYIATVLLFEIGSAICGASNNMTALIIGRVIAGVGGSGMYSGCLNYIGLVTSPKEQPIYGALVGLIWAMGTVLGPVIGGAFANSSATWRWAFYINLVIGGVFAPAYFLYLPSIDPQKGVSVSKRLKQIDWVGMTIFFGAMVSFIMAISFGGLVFAWNSGSEIALWVVGGVLWIVFAIVTHWSLFIEKTRRLYPAEMMKRPLIQNLQIQLFMGSGVMMGTAYYVPLYFQFARGDNPLYAGVRLLPYVCMVGAFALGSGALLTKLGYYMPWFTFGSALIVIGSGLMYTLTPTTEVANVYGYTILIGVGVGSYVMSCYPVGQNLVLPTEIPQVIGFLSVAQSTGITIFFAVMGTVYDNEAIKNVEAVLPGTPKSEILSALTGTSSAGFKDLDPDKRTQVIQAIIKSMAPVWLILLTGGAISFVLSLFLGRNKLFGGVEGGQPTAEEDGSR